MTAGAFLDGLAGGMNMARGIKRDKEFLELERERIEAMKNAPARSVIGAGGGLNAADYTYDGAISDRVSHAYGRFTDAGLPPHVASGLVGNMMQESGAEINPAVVGDNGNAFGSGQMNGDRRHAYMAFAKSRGVDPTDFDTQIDWMLHEGQTTEKAAWDAILSTDNVQDAARVASEKYWRPGTPHLSRRVGYASSVHDNLYKPEKKDADRRPQPRAVSEVIDKGQQIVDRFMKKQGV